MNPQISQLTPAQTAERTDAVVLDVREVAEGRIAGSTHIPLAGQGYDVANLDGGMTRWLDEGRPTT